MAKFDATFNGEDETITLVMDIKTARSVIYMAGLGFETGIYSKDQLQAINAGCLKAAKEGLDYIYDK